MAKRIKGRPTKSEEIKKRVKKPATGKPKQPDLETEFKKPVVKKTVDYMKMIKRSHRIIPFSKEKIEQPGFALTGDALKQYNRTRRNNGKGLPDKSPQAVAENIRRETFTKLDKSIRLVEKALTSPGPIAKGSAPLIPRSIKINLSRKKAEALGFTFIGDKEEPEEAFVKVKLKDITGYIPSQSLTAPENPLLNKLKSLVNLKQISDTADEQDEPGNDAPPEPIDEHNGNGNEEGDDSKSKIDEKEILQENINTMLDQLNGISKYDQVYPQELQSKRQEALYETLEANGHQQKLSAADTPAYYDFFDLKLCLPPVWTEITEKDVTYALDESIPNFQLLKRFLKQEKVDDSDTIVDDPDAWNAFEDYLDESGIEWDEIVADAYKHRFYKNLEECAIILQGDPESLDSLRLAHEEILKSLVKKGGLAADDEAVSALVDEAFADLRDIANYSVSFISLSKEAKKLENELPDMAEDFRTNADNFKAKAQAKKNIWIEAAEFLFQKWNTIFTSDNPPDGAETGAKFVEKNMYSFNVFAPGQANYGLLINYRQKWNPQNWQVGDLVETIPLTPKETRKYTKKVKMAKRRARKELENSLSIRRSDDSTSNRAESQIVKKAQENTSFQASTSGSVNVEFDFIGGSGGHSVGFNTSAGKDSSDTKRKIRESVAKSAREFKQDRKMEISTEESKESELTSTNEITNPNDEITVTYLFYELQRQYMVSEHLHSVESVILYPNEVPAPHEINWDWILRHDWILKRTLLDDQFKPALDYVLEGKDMMDKKITTLEKKKEQMSKMTSSMEARLKTLENIEIKNAGEAKLYSDLLAKTTSVSEGLVTEIWEGIFGGDEGGQMEAYKQQIEEAKERADRALQKTKAVRDELMMQRNALERAVDEYNKAVLERDRNIRHVNRLIHHIRDYILYYMQAIWSYEPPDQRYLRLYNKMVNFAEYPAEDTDILVRVRSYSGSVDDVLQGTSFEIILTGPKETSMIERKLPDIADIENLLGFKGNYMIFPLRVQSYHTAYMAQSFVNSLLDDEAAQSGNTASADIENIIANTSKPQELGQMAAADPDPKAGLSADNLMEAVEFIGQNKEHIPPFITVKLNKLLEQGLLSPDLSQQRIIVPTDSLYIEALPGKHPIMEDFKLTHRMIDAEKARAELKSMELDNIRAEAMLRQLDTSDPDVDKTIRIEGAPNVTHGV